MLRRNSVSLITSPIAETMPSAVLSNTLPTKPSVTTTSATLWNMSLPSMLPMKLIGAQLEQMPPPQAPAELPLVRSSPIESSATLGRSIPSTAEA